MPSRYFRNPYLDSWKNDSGKVTKEWLENEADSLFTKILNCKECDYDDIDAYTGLSGLCYGLLKATTLLHQKERDAFDFYVKKLESLLQDEVKKKLSGSTARRQSRFLLGTLGAFVIGILCEYKRSNTLNEEYFNRVKDISNVVLQDVFQGHGEDEMLVGRAGYIAAVLMLRHELGEKVNCNFLIPVLKKILDSGRKYAQRNCSLTPLMYQYHGKEYVGAAHGLMGILQMLISCYEMLDDLEKKDVKETLDWIISIQFENGNFPTNAAHLKQRHEDDELIQWCHGAGGAVFLFIVAYLKIGEEKYLKAAEAAAGILWEKGVLYKGPGICHGVAGNGYAFLMLYRLTQQERFLHYARCFALIFCSSNFKRNARTPDSPLSLYEGIAGSLCYLCDLAEPINAQFPLIPIKFGS
uniref:LanC-like protein 3 n=1 Tax=Syphacia muris TaxID=451379 RepID=A0A0N5ALL8_9BILA